MTSHFEQPAAEDTREVPFGCAVKQFCGRLSRLELEIDFGRVALIRADLCTRFVNREPLFVAPFDNGFQFVACEVAPRCRGAGDQILDPNPSALLKSEPGFVRFVTQHEGHKLADSDASFFVHG